MSFSVEPGQLLVVTGQVGCGKTTLLHSILGETVSMGGTSTIRGTTAYVE